MSRIARIDEIPELKDTLSDALIEGVSITKLSDKDGPWYEIFGISDRATMTAWARREDVQAMVARKIRDRSNRVLSRTDTKIMAFLESKAKIPLETLLKIRREFAGATVNINRGDPAEALSELALAAHDNPELAAAFAEMRGERDPDEDDTGDA